MIHIPVYNYRPSYKRPADVTPPLTFILNEPAVATETHAAFTPTKPQLGFLCDDRNNIPLLD